ncbi:MAG TPA: UDP-4-amino-4,6-dideoxy-N-acetyl-beta-L-altrosamine transaminase [Anaerolineae bacterium]|nr:UDP-4-amino-4,6-dideoxy-N-acetyl-beta-L-altrosamine transaminase [Anaerolineae bacterium]
MTLAIDGGEAVRGSFLPYGRQLIGEDDIAAVAEVLRGDWLTTGPMVGAFEEAFAEVTGVKESVAVSNGTAALHAAMYALGIGPGDEVIVPTMTFAASANSVLYQGGRPVLVDVEPTTMLIDVAQVEAKITAKTKAIVAVDYAGQPCDYERLLALAQAHDLAVVADACHAIGGSYQGRPVGSLADLSTFSLHPVKHMTTGEGGMITTDNEDWARRMRVFRNHGITTDHRQRQDKGSWFYEMVDLGYNYRLTDFQCALGMSQLRKLEDWVVARQMLAGVYDEALAGLDGVEPLVVRPEVEHAYHLYMVRVDMSRLRVDKAAVFQAMRGENIGVNVHYIPVHLHPFYRREMGTKVGDCPVAEAAYDELLTLPLYPQMDKEDVWDVVAALGKVMRAYQR